MARLADLAHGGGSRVEVDQRPAAARGRQGERAERAAEVPRRHRRRADDHLRHGQCGPAGRHHAPRRIRPTAGQGDVAAVGVHHVDAPPAIPLAQTGKGDLSAIGRPSGCVVGEAVVGQWRRVAAISVHHVDVLLHPLLYAMEMDVDKVPAVGRPIRVAAPAAVPDLGGGQAHRITLAHRLAQRLDEDLLHPLAAAAESQPRPIGRPGRLHVELGLGVLGDVGHVAARGGHDVDFQDRLALADKGDLLAVGRPGRLDVGAGVIGQARFVAAVGVHDVDFVVAVAVADEDHLPAVGRDVGRHIGRRAVSQLDDSGAVRVHGEDVGRAARAAAGEEDAAAGRRFGGGGPSGHQRDEQQESKCE